MNGPVSAGRWSRRVLAVHTAFIYLFLWVPIGVLAVFSFNTGRQTAVWRGFTLDWCHRLLANEALLAAVRNSLLVAALTTLLATVIGTLAALALRRPETPGRGGTLAADTGGAQRRQQHANGGQQRHLAHKKSGTSFHGASIAGGLRLVKLCFNGRIGWSGWCVLFVVFCSIR